MSKLGTAEYMQGLVEAAKKLEEAQSAVRYECVEVEGLIAQALDLIRERVQWPKQMDGKEGFYCEDCGLVCYVSREWVEKDPGRFDRCPQCKSWGWLFITQDNWQPKVRFGTPERKVCKHCGTIVYGARGKECPMCNAELG